MQTEEKIPLSTMVKDLRGFFVLWLTQALSSLGSMMTSFALILWAYQQSGSALMTALLTVSSYAPYVLMSILAGALSDRWNKKIVMLVSDVFAALCTVGVLVLFRSNRLEIWHLYLLNALNGLMNTLQQPASEIAVTMLTPKKYIQRVSGLQSLSWSIINVLKPSLATAIFLSAGLETVIWIDLGTFAVAFFSLLCFIRLPKPDTAEEKKEGVLQSARAGLRYLRQNRGILDLIFFLAAINFSASIYDAALPARILPVAGGGEGALALLTSCCGLAMLAGSLIATAMPTPKSRVRVICNTLLISMSTENIILALTHAPVWWCIGGILGWIGIPLMNCNMNALFRQTIPVTMQGRVYAARNTLQFFTIPLGNLLGGFLVDRVYEPLMAAQSDGSLLTAVFGTGKGSGATFLFFCVAFLGVITCLIFRRDPHIWALERAGIAPLTESQGKM